MTRKHFEAAAAIVKDWPGADGAGNNPSMTPEFTKDRRLLAQGFVELFEQFSPNFNRERFLKACGL